MSTPTRAVTFTPLVLDGVANPVVATGYYTITPSTSYADGIGRVLPLPFEVALDGEAVTVDLPVTGADWALKVVGSFVSVTGDTYQTEEYIQIPSGAGGVDFEDLGRVDPETLDPAAVTYAAFLGTLLVPDPDHSGLYLMYSNGDSVVQPPATESFTYNPDGSIATETSDGVVTSYSYNADGSVHTDIANGVTRTYSYDTAGKLTGIVVS